MQKDVWQKIDAPWPWPTRESCYHEAPPSSPASSKWYTSPLRDHLRVGLPLGCLQLRIFRIFFIFSSSAQNSMAIPKFGLGIPRHVVFTLYLLTIFSPFWAAASCFFLCNLCLQSYFILFVLTNSLMDSVHQVLSLIARQLKRHDAPRTNSRLLHWVATDSKNSVPQAWKANMFPVWRRLPRP